MKNKRIVRYRETGSQNEISRESRQNTGSAICRLGACAISRRTGTIQPISGRYATRGKCDHVDALQIDDTALIV